MCLTEFDSSLLNIFKKSANRLEFKVACRVIEYLKVHEFVAIRGINSRNTYMMRIANIKIANWTIIEIGKVSTNYYGLFGLK